MITYKSQKTPTKTKEYFEMLQQLWEHNWEWQQDKYWISIFFKKVPWKTDRDKKQTIKTPEWIEFFEIYKDIKNNWLSNDNLIIKYNKLVQEWLHDTIIQNLKDYKLYLEVKKKKDYALMASTYINQARYKDKWEIVEDQSKKFLNDLFMDRKLEKTIIDNIMLEINKWEEKQKKEITFWVANNIIDYVLWK